MAAASSGVNPQQLIQTNESNNPATGFDFKLKQLIEKSRLLMSRLSLEDNRDLALKMFNGHFTISIGASDTLLIEVSDENRPKLDDAAFAKKLTDIREMVEVYLNKRVTQDGTPDIQQILNAKGLTIFIDPSQNDKSHVAIVKFG